MQQENKLEIKTLSVQIRVLTIDQKRFTKSVFDQLPWGILVDYNMDEDCVVVNQQIIGYVRVSLNKHIQRIGLFVKDGQLFKAKGRRYTYLPSLEDGYDDYDRAIAVNRRIEQQLINIVNESSQLFISI